MRLHSAPMGSNIFNDDFSCEDTMFVSTTSQQLFGQLLVAIIIIVAVTVCEKRTRYLPSIVSFQVYNIRGHAIRIHVATLRKISVSSRSKAINISHRWGAFSHDYILYNQQQLGVVDVQCKQHHREIQRHRNSTYFKTLYKTFTKSNSYLINVVDYTFIVGIVRIINNKKVLVESIIFAYLISLDLYS